MMTELYGFETGESKETRLRFVSIVFLERLIVLRAAVPEFPIGQAAAAPCLGALNRGIWQKSTKSKKIKGKSPPGQPCGQENPSKSFENPRKSPEISGNPPKSCEISRKSWKFSKILGNLPDPFEFAPESPESPEPAGAAKNGPRTIFWRYGTDDWV